MLNFERAEIILRTTFCNNLLYLLGNTHRDYVLISGNPVSCYGAVEKAVPITIDI